MRVRPRRLTRWLLAAALYAVALYQAAVVVTYADEAARASHELNARLGPEAQVSSQFRSLLGSASFGLYEGAERDGEEVARLAARQGLERRRAERVAWELVGVAAALLLLQLLCGRRGLRNRLAAHLLGVSLCFLAVGLLAPALSLVVSYQVPLLENVVLQQQTKSILGTIRSLFEGGHVGVAALLLTFSVLTPVLKTALTFWVLAGRDRAGRVARLIKALGKWSMADVFVVSLLLTFFTLSGDGLTEARLGLGIYFFAGYVLLSLLAAQLMAWP